MLALRAQPQSIALSMVFGCSEKCLSFNEYFKSIQYLHTYLTQFDSLSNMLYLQKIYNY